MSGVNKKGFLLFEVMMAIVIITAGLLFITRSYSASKDSIRRSGEVFRTALLLEEGIWEFEERGEIEAESSSGDFKKAEGYEWEIEAEHLEEEGEFAPAEINIVTLSVFEKKKPVRTRYSLWTYLKDESF